MDSTSQETLSGILRRYRAEIIDRGTDWVSAQSVDLSNGRSREQTQALVARVVDAQAKVLLEGDEAPLAEFIEFVTSLRASGEFRVSTLLRGVMSFRAGLIDVVRREVADPMLVTRILVGVDTVAQSAAFRTADVYTEKLNHTISQRRHELEAELEELATTKERELDDKIRTIAEQSSMLNAVSCPVIQIWDRILVVPLIGELGPERAASMQERVLNAIVETRSSLLLVDVTGLSTFDARTASELVRLLDSVRLLGAIGSLVGLSALGARAFAEADVDLRRVATYASLHDGLMASFRRAGLSVVYRSDPTDAKGEARVHR